MAHILEGTYASLFTPGETRFGELLRPCYDFHISLVPERFFGSLHTKSALRYFSYAECF